MRKTALSVIIVVLFLATAMVPAMASKAPAPASDGKVLNIIQGNGDKKPDVISIPVEQTSVDALVTDVQSFKAWLENARPFRDLKLTEEEKNEIKSNINNIIASLNVILEENNQPSIEPAMIFREMFETEPGRSTILSVGNAYTFIPFYDYETFLGVMLRPMWLFYPPIWMIGGGYTGNFNLNGLPPRIEYGDRLGSHIVRTTLFSGVYINVGDLGYDKILSGLVILFGNARVVM